MSVPPETVIAHTRTWLERAVIGLNLCPFAKAVFQSERIRYVVCPATTTAELREALITELQMLHGCEREQCETTLLIHPEVLRDFLDYNDFLDEADAVLQQLDLEGEIQIASFHPHYQFAETQPDDITNFSNRSPYPLLHLLREEAVEEALASYTNAEQIVERNLATLRALGAKGWAALNIPDGETPS